MTLHKELVALFRCPEPPEVDYPRSADRPEDGYFWTKIDFVLVLSSSGEVIDVERRPWRIAGFRRGALLVPSALFPGPHGPSGFLWGHSTHALGLSRSRRGVLKVDEVAFNHFRTFHRAVLSKAADPSIRAFLLFLQRWTPASLDTSRPAYEVLGGTVAFRFQYENDFLHERDAARRIWARQLKPLGAAGDGQGPTAAQQPRQGTGDA